MKGPKRRVLPAEELRLRIIRCSRCPRLVEYRHRVKPKASFASQSYWRKPVPGFGDLNGRLLVIGLAPATHGGFRTGRIFTGDASSRFLVSSLYSAGFANQPVSESIDDGLVYRDCYLTAAVKCAPPNDRPTREEFANCSVYLDGEISLMPNLKSVLALGSLAFGACLDHLRRSGVEVKGLEFSHGRKYLLSGCPSFYASYHPSPRNTNTGKLTEEMLTSLLEKIRRDFKARI